MPVYRLDGVTPVVHPSAYTGIPATVKRAFSDDEVAWKSEATALYQALARRCEQSLEPVELLADVEPTRKRISASDFKPLHRFRP